MDVAQPIGRLFSGGGDREGLLCEGAASESQGIETAVCAEIDEEKIHLAKESSQTDHDGERYTHPNQASFPH